MDLGIVYLFSEEVAERVKRIKIYLTPRLIPMVLPRLFFLPTSVKFGFSYLAGPGTFLTCLQKSYFVPLPIPADLLYLFEFPKIDGRSYAALLQLEK